MSDPEIIRYCSPTLAGLKTASLFNTACDDYESLRVQILRINGKLRHNGLRMIPLSLRQGRALIYIYRESALAKDILRNTARRILETLGYDPKMSSEVFAGCQAESANPGISPMKSVFSSAIRKRMSSASWKDAMIMSAPMCGKRIPMKKRQKRHSLFIADAPNFIQNGWKTVNRLTG